jgi:cation diffusion facilitator family transporter
LVITAVAQAVVFALSGSAALLADLIHNVGDALTAVPVGIAFLLRSVKAERYAGMMVLVAILVSMAIAAVTAIDKLINRDAPDHLVALAIAGAIGVVGNAAAARVRTRAGKKLGSDALVADGHHARVDAIVSVGVILSAGVVAIGFPIADPLIALGITIMIAHIARDAWLTVSGRGHEPGHRHKHPTK